MNSIAVCIRQIFSVGSLALSSVLVAPFYADAAEAPKEKIAIAYAAISPSMAGVWMAKDIGAFERNGLNVDLVHISSGATAIQALVGGSVQAALGASNAVIAAALKGAPIVAVASNTSRPGMALWVQAEIQRAEQLQGKTLAITRYGSTSDFVTRLVLRKLGLDGKVEIRQFGGVVEADVGFRARQAEGRVASQAPGPQAKLLVDAAELGIPFSMNLLAVSNEYYRKSPKSVEGIVAAYIEGIAALKIRKPQALKMLTKYMGQGEARRRRTMNLSPSISTPLHGSIPRRWIPSWRWLAARGRPKRNSLTTASWTAWFRKALSTSFTGEASND